VCYSRIPACVEIAGQHVEIAGRHVGASIEVTGLILAIAWEKPAQLLNPRTEIQDSAPPWDRCCDHPVTLGRLEVPRVARILPPPTVCYAGGGLEGAPRTLPLIGEMHKGARDNQERAQPWIAKPAFDNSSQPDQAEGISKRATRETCP
jgi:hypothetical protein